MRIYNRNSSLFHFDEGSSKKVFFVAKRSKRMPILLLQHQNRISINGIERSAFTSTITLSPSPLLTAAVFSLLSAKPNFFQILDSVLFDTPKNSDSVHHNVFSVANVFALEYPKKLDSYSDPSSGKILYRVGENNSKTLTDYKIEFFISVSLN